MFNRLSIAFAVAVLLGFPHSAGADPITYDFSGTLDPPSGSGPLGGITSSFGFSGPFSGSITFNDTVGQTAPGDPGVLIGTPDVTATFNLNGLSFQYANPSNVLTNTYGLTQASLNLSAFGVSIGLDGGTETNGKSGYSGIFGITLSNRGLPSIYPNQYSIGSTYPTIDLSKFDIRSASMTLYTPMLGVVIQETGVITSFDIATVPEPTSITVYSFLALAEVMRRISNGLARRRKLKRPDRSLGNA